MSQDSFQERTERATTHRREKAREEGQVAKSQELNSAAVICVGFLTLYMLGPYMADNLMTVMRHIMANASVLGSTSINFASVFSDYMLKFFVVMGPILAIMVVLGFSVNVAQVGFKITPKAMEPKLEKLDLLKGLKRMFSLRSGVTMVRDIIKLFVVGFVAYKVIAGEFESFFNLADMSVAQVAVLMGKLSLELALKTGAIILVIGILDYVYQKYEFEKSIKMSRQDIKDEHKDTEGSPQIKSRIRQVQQQMARSRMMDAVPMADVVVTNPTHLAVALKYDHENMGAPTVIAKGQRLIAQQIKKVAREHNVPVIEDKPLARALYKMCDVGQTVPAQLYRAVAEILAYVYKAKGKVIN